MEQRRAILQEHLRDKLTPRSRMQQLLWGKGKPRRIERESDASAIVVEGRPVNHILHLLLTLLTMGVWGIVWLAMAMAGGEKALLIDVDPQGRVTESRM